MSKKLTQKEVLERFKKVHGDEYDYSLVEYVKNHTKVKIICKKDGHGIFKQTPNVHLSGAGCRKCAENIKLTKQEVLDRFLKVHGDKYDYSLVEYVNAKTKIKIRCRKDGHGNFEQRACSHYAGQGCPECANINRTLEQKEVLERFKKVHGDEYDYSLVDYKGGGNDVIIICCIHGNFKQQPSNHLQGKGCPDCGTLKITKSKRKTTEQFIDDAKLVHGDEYDYSLVEYVNAKTKIKIRCRKDGHGNFEQRANDHLRGAGCRKCSIKRISEKQTKSTEDFIKQAKKVHTNKKYGYEKVEYVNAKTKIIIICPKHGDFKQLPNVHLQGRGCNDCGRNLMIEKQRLTIDEFIERSNIIHNNFYEYEKVEYINAATKVIITCPAHGDFKQLPNGHLQGRGCNDCGYLKTGDIKRKPLEQFIEEANLIHGGIYNYDNVDYRSNREKVLIECAIHGEFPQDPNSHIHGVGCPKCYNKNEGRLAIILNEIGVVHRQYKIENKRYDFYLHEYNLIIERDGEQHYTQRFNFSNKKRLITIGQNHQNDIEKTKLAKSKGYKISRIPYWLSEEDERKEIQNILNGKPTYPDVPDLEQAKTKPLPK